MNDVEHRIDGLEAGGVRRTGGTGCKCSEVRRCMRSRNNRRVTSTSSRLGVILLLAFVCRGVDAGWIDPDTEDEHKSMRSLHDGRVYELVSWRGWDLCLLLASRSLVEKDIQKKAKG